MPSITGRTNTTQNYVITNHYTARLPIEQTQASCLDPVIIGLKGLTNGFEGAGKVMKINDNNDGLIFSVDNHDVYTGTGPILINSSNEISYLLNIIDLLSNNLMSKVLIP